MVFFCGTVCFLCNVLELLFYVSSADSKCKEESAKLLGCLIRNCERLIHPYIAPVHKVKLVSMFEINAFFYPFSTFLENF